MKAVSYFMIMVMLIAVAALFVLKRPDGGTWLSAAGITSTAQQQVSELQESGKAALQRAKAYGDTLITSESHQQDASKSVKVYRWQDENGQWHYSDSPSEQASVYELDSSKITVIAAEDTSILAPPAKTEKKPATTALATALNPQAVQQVMQDAKHVQQLMDERKKRLDEALEENQ